MERNSDREFIRQIISGGKSEEAALRAIYQRLSRRVIGMIVNMKGTPDQGKTYLHDAIVILWEKIVLGKYEAKASIDQYTIGIAKKLFYRGINAYSKETIMEDWDRLPSSWVSYLPEHAKSATVIEEILEQIGQSCKDLVSEKLLQGKSLLQIAEIYAPGTSAQNISKKIQKCLHKMRSLVSPKVSEE